MLLLAASKNTNNCSGFNREAGAAVTTGTQNTAIGASCLGNRGDCSCKPEQLFPIRPGSRSNRLGKKTTAAENTAVGAR